MDAPPPPVLAPDVHPVDVQPPVDEDWDFAESFFSFDDAVDVNEVKYNKHTSRFTIDSTATRDFYEALRSEYNKRSDDEKDDTCRAVKKAQKKMIKDPHGNYIFALLTQYQPNISNLISSLLWICDDFTMFAQEGLIAMPYADDYFLKATAIPHHLCGMRQITYKEYCIVGKIQHVVVSAMQILYDVATRFGKEALVNGVRGQDCSVKSTEFVAVVKFELNGRPVRVFVSDSSIVIEAVFNST